MPDAPIQSAPWPAIGQRWADKGETGRAIEIELSSGNMVYAQVVAAPKKPHTIGRATSLRIKTLWRRYRLENPQ